MDSSALGYVRSRIREQAATYDVYRTQDSGAYTDSQSSVGQRDVAVYNAASSQLTVLEGVGQDLSYAGLVVPDGTDLLRVGDELRLAANNARRYVVRERFGTPTDVDPDLWVLGLDRSNSA